MRIKTAAKFTQAIESGFYSQSPIAFYKNPVFDVVVVIELASGTIDHKKGGVYRTCVQNYP